MANYKDAIKAKQAEIGSGKRLSVGKYPGSVITDVNEKSHEGQTLWEVHVETPDGGGDKMTIWYNTHTAISDHASQERYIGSMARLCRLYTDLGLPEPDGPSHVEIEQAAYERLGELKGRKCTVVVQLRRDAKAKPGETNVYINSPSDTSGASTEAAVVPRQTAFSGAAPSIDSIPF
jgi:hypothetical protein